jgi:hypothetical protein
MQSHDTYTPSVATGTTPQAAKTAEHSHKQKLSKDLVTPSPKAESTTSSQKKKTSSFPAIPNYRPTSRTMAVKDKSELPFIHQPVRYYIPHSRSYNNEKVAILSKYHPCTLKDVHSFSKDNEHPLCAAFRAIAEAFALGEAQRELEDAGITHGWIRDFGGAVNRHHALKRNHVHSCKPDYEYKDISRNFRLKGSNYCRKTFSTCNLTTAASMSVHAIYYFDPWTMARVLMNQTVPVHYAVMHVYDGAEGTLMNGEMSYTTNLNGQYVVRAKGNWDAYTHGTMQWLRDDHVTTPEGITMVWKKVRSFADVHVFRFVATKDARILRQKHTDQTAPRPVGDPYNKILDQCYRLAEPINEKGFRQYVNRCMRAADQEGLETLKIQELAGLRYTSLSKTQLPAVSRNFLREAARHNTRLGLKLETWRQRLAFLLATILMLTLTLTYESNAGESWMMRLFTLAVGILGYAYIHISEHYVTNLNAKLFDYCCTLTREEWKPLAGKEKVLKYVPPKHTPCEPGLCAYPMVFHRDFVPMMPRRCSHNTEACVRNRVLNATTAKAEAWEGVDLPDFLVEVAGKISLELEPMSWDEWIERFPGKKRDRLIKEQVDAEFEIYDEKEWNRSKLFEKREFMPSSDKPPRPIHSSHVELNFGVGRWLIPCMELLAALLPEEYYFPLHGDSREIGEFVEQHGSTCAEMLENDFSGFDSTKNRWLLCLLIKFFFLCGFPRDVLRRMQLDTEWIHVKGPFGLRYVMRSVGASGRSETLAGNTVGNIIIMFIVFEDWLAAMIIKGDDSICFLWFKLSESQKKTVIQRITDLGFKCKLVTKKLCDVEFCSSYVVPCVGGHVLIPKPGKLLAKTFWCKNTNYTLEQQQAQFAGILNGMKNVLFHLPIFRRMYETKIYKENFKTESVVQEYNEYAKEMIHYEEMDIINWFEECYGLSAEEVYQIESLITDEWPIELYGSEVEILLRKDWGEPNYSDLLVVEEEFADKHEEALYVIFKDMMNVLIEEILRWYLPYFSLMIGLYESYVLLTPYNFVAHLVLDVMMKEHGFLIALLLHALHNSLVSLMGTAAPLSMVKNSKKKNSKSRGKSSNKENEMIDRMARQLAPKLKPLIKQGFRTGGSALGNWIAPGIGGELGYQAGAGVSKILGFGDYKVKSNSLTNAPQFGKSPPSIRIRNREYVTDVSTSTSFLAQNFTVNPGNSVLFPWLSGVAASYQQYKVNGMVVYYNSTSASAIGSTNTALGAIMMSSNYDLAEAPYSSKQEVLSAYFSSSGPPSEDLVHAIECDPKQRPIDVLYIDHNGESEVDPALYNLCNFQMASTGAQEASVGGEMWIAYDITLMKPKMREVGQYSLLENAAWDTTDTLGAIQTEVIGTPMPVLASGGGYDTIDLSAYRGQTILITFVLTGTGFSGVSLASSSSQGLTRGDF